jgi:hypothetical protein
MTGGKRRAIKHRILERLKQAGLSIEQINKKQDWQFLGVSRGGVGGGQGRVVPERHPENVGSSTRDPEGAGRSLVSGSGVEEGYQSEFSLFHNGEGHFDAWFSQLEADQSDSASQGSMIREGQSSRRFELAGGSPVGGLSAMSLEGGDGLVGPDVGWLYEYGGEIYRYEGVSLSLDPSVGWSVRVDDEPSQGIEGNELKVVRRLLRPGKHVVADGDVNFFYLGDRYGENLLQMGGEEVQPDEVAGAGREWMQNLITAYGLAGKITHITGVGWRLGDPVQSSVESGVGPKTQQREQDRAGVEAELDELVLAPPPILGKEAEDFPQTRYDAVAALMVADRKHQAARTASAALDGAPPSAEKERLQRELTEAATQRQRAEDWVRRWGFADPAAAVEIVSGFTT